MRSHSNLTRKIKGTELLKITRAYIVITWRGIIFNPTREISGTELLKLTRTYMFIVTWKGIIFNFTHEFEIDGTWLLKTTRAYIVIIIMLSCSNCWDQFSGTCRGFFFSRLFTSILHFMVKDRITKARLYSNMASSEAYATWGWCLLLTEQYGWQKKLLEKTTNRMTLTTITCAII